MKFILSTEKPNRYGFRIITKPNPLGKGIILDAFKVNPVMLYNHDRKIPPIGNWKDVEVDKDNNLVAEDNYDEKDPFALNIKSKVEQDFLKHASVQINILKTTDDPKYCLAGQTGPTVTECELWEASVVDIPGNVGAVRLFYQGKEIEGDISLALQELTKTHIKPDNKMKEIALALGLKEDATEKEITDALTALAAKAKENTAESKTDSDKLIDGLIALGTANGWITSPEIETTYRSLAAAKFDDTLKLIQIPKAGSSSAAATAGKNETLTDAIAKLAANMNGGNTATLAGVPADRKDWSYRDWDKKDPKGLAKLSAETRDKLFADWKESRS